MVHLFQNVLQLSELDWLEQVVICSCLLGNFDIRLNCEGGIDDDDRVLNDSVLLLDEPDLSCCGNPVLQGHIDIHEYHMVHIWRLLLLLRPIELFLHFFEGLLSIVCEVDGLDVSKGLKDILECHHVIWDIVHD